ncbi:MAG: MliC family protein [Patescibacteria group bacterium]|jgi:membrane-bound inhibitor of C-type lysozyme
MAKSKTGITVLIVIIVAIVIGVIVWHYLDVNKQINSVTYTCNDSKTISAKFYQSKIKLTLSDNRNLTLPQTKSADGERYANRGEKTIFWGKGNGATLTENGKITFDKCKTK